jgi:glycosyltransferase involved in cell wall biosynthesis
MPATYCRNLISVIIPCRDEERHIEKCLASVLAFETPPEVNFEILVLDGRSVDRTRELVAAIAARHPSIQLLDNPGRIQSTAVNLGVRAARGAWIMRLDAHAFYPADYLRLCHETAQRSHADNVGGLFIAEISAETYSAKIVQALTTHKFGVGDAGYRTNAKEAYADTVPYGFFRREVFDRIGWLDERLVRAQDYEFNRRIIAVGGKVLRNPAIRVYYFNQPTLKKFFFKQFFREAPYNAYLWYIAPYAFAWRHAITGAFAAGVIGGIPLAVLSPWMGIPYLGVLTLYLLLSLIAATQQAVRYREPLHAMALPVFFFLYHFLHGVGVLHGLLRLLIRTAPVQAQSEPWPGAGWLRVPTHTLSLS